MRIGASVGRLAAVAALCTAAGPAFAGPGFPGIYFAEDVVGQFRSLALRGDGLAFNLGPLPEELEPTLCKHLQGFARLPGPGTPYLYVSRSGNDPGFTCVTGGAADVPGNLYVVRMGSRETTGERLRSNRLNRDWPVQFVGSSIWTKPPDPRDRLVNAVVFDGMWPRYMHPGGMQIVDDVLAVALEASTGSITTAPENTIGFVDVADPESPRPLGQWPRPGSTTNLGPAGLVGITPVLNPDGPGLRYLMITTGKDNGVVRMWRSRSTTADPSGPTDLRSPNLDFEQVARRDYPELEAYACSGGEDWPEGRDAYQSLNFVREGSLTGPLYAVGARNDGVAGNGRDHLALFRVDVDDYGNVGPCMLKFVAKLQVTSYPFGGHGDSAALSAASGTYVSPAGELIVYGTEYENDGPWERNADGTPGNRTVRFVEWRNVNVVRDGSPTLKPSVDVPARFEVPEGGSVALTGAGRAPATKAWIQLFEDDGAGRDLPAFGGDDDWLQIDYADRLRDRFEDFHELDVRTQTDFDDNAGSWRWFAPVGCSIRANEDAVGRTTGVFPGRHTRTLHGTGRVVREGDLDQVRNDADDATMDDKVSSVQFGALPGYPWSAPSCDDYYAAPIGVQWDLNDDGVFETPGPQASFSAALLDGPYQAVIGVRAQHPTDPTELGRSDRRGVAVMVRNVAPAIGAREIRDSAGNLVGTTVPFVLQGQPVTYRATFTDPGRADRQTANLSWGDGTTTPHTAFAAFNDAFGGATGRLSHTRAFPSAGERLVTLQVSDDDGGTVSATTAVRVLTPVQALAELGSVLDGLIAAAGQDDVRRDLEAARVALLGARPPASQSGALDMLRTGQTAAADAFLVLALERLARAQAAGADVAMPIAVVRQVRSSLSR
jgi:hypothetical protein